MGEHLAMVDTDITREGMVTKIMHMAMKMMDTITKMILLAMVTKIMGKRMANMAMETADTVIRADMATETVDTVPRADMAMATVIMATAKVDTDTETLDMAMETVDTIMMVDMVPLMVDMAMAKVDTEEVTDIQIIQAQ